MCSDQVTEHNRLRTLSFFNHVEAFGHVEHLHLDLHHMFFLNIVVDIERVQRLLLLFEVNQRMYIQGTRAMSHRMGPEREEQLCLS